MVRYILETWQRVKEKESVDRQDWYQAAIASLNWVLSQQNPDGGFPQVVEIECLNRLFKQTGNPLFDRLKNRVMQLNFFVQVADGPYQGAMTEAIADPWLERRSGFEWRGSPYTSELVADLMLQLMEMGLVKKP